MSVDFYHQEDMKNFNLLMNQQNWNAKDNLNGKANVEVYSNPF